MLIFAVIKKKKKNFSDDSHIIDFYYVKKMYKSVYLLNTF